MFLALRRTHPQERAAIIRLVRFELTLMRVDGSEPAVRNVTSVSDGVLHRSISGRPRIAPKPRQL
jgi:hypothetical protein